MNPIWAPEAIADLAALRAYIAQDDPAAAQRVALHIIHSVETLLPNSPEMGRPGRVPGTREVVIPRTPYIVPYRLVGNTIQVLRVFHSARQWPGLFEPPRLATCILAFVSNPPCSATIAHFRNSAPRQMKMGTIASPWRHPGQHAAFLQVSASVPLAAAMQRPVVLGSR
jgi:toxin ParE1/3/4